MVIKINYTSSDIYVSTNVSPIYVVVNYSGVSTGGGVWGQITGTLSNQTDLQTALDAKFDDPTGTTAQYLRGDGSLATFPTIPSGTVTSVGLTMPSAFSVANSPVTTNGTLAVTGAGTAAQYVRGDGALATFPNTASGGSSVNYYLNGSVSASVTGYKQLANTAVIGAGTNFNLTGNGLIAQFLTDAGNPNRVEIPGGAWNFEMYFSVSSSGGNQKFYVELLKYNGSTFTSIATGSTNPEEITGGTATDLYLTSLAVPTTSLLVTDRLAIRVYIVDNSIGRTITLHTEDNNLCEILTTFAGGIAALNGLTANTQYLATGTSGTDFNISSLTDTHTFNLPTASATNRGALSSADWSTFSGKVGGSGVAGQVAYWNGTNSQTGSATLTYSPTSALLVNNSVTAASLIARGTNLTPTLVASANNDVLVGLDVNPTFNNGAFTGVTNYAIRSGGNLLFTNTNFNIVNNIGASIISHSGSGVTFSSGNSSSFFRFLNFGAGQYAMYIFPSTNIGINTATDAGYKLDVNGTARVSGASTFARITATTSGIELDYNSGILYHAGGSGSYYQYIDGVSYTFRSRTATGSLIFATQDIERMRITSGGNLLVGTTTDSGEKLQVLGNVLANTIRLQETATYSTAVVMNNRNANQQWGIAVDAAAVDDKFLAFIDQTNSLVALKLAALTGAATFGSSVTASSFIKSGGTSSQYLMADGSVTTGGGGGSVDELQVSLICQVFG